MNDGGANEGGEPTRVGVVAPETDAEGVVEAVIDAGGSPLRGSASVAADAEVVVAVGDAAVSTLVESGVSIPVLPVGTGFDSDEPVETGVERVLGGEYDVHEHALLRVETPDERRRAVFDVAFTTVEPATITEFTVGVLDESTESGRAGERVARVRADGVVVATPAGSRGYARAAGGPVVVPGSGVAAVVPVSPFSTDPECWVLALSGVSITVERDAEVAVTLDGRALDTVSPGTTVRLVRDGALSVVVPSGRENE